MDEVSGNYGAAQGRDTGQKTASGYAQETVNAGLNVREVMETFSTLQVKRDELILKFIQQGYTKEDYERITGEAIDPIELTHYNFSIEQSRGTNSPAYRIQLEQELLQQVMAELLPYEVFLEVSTNPVMIQAKQKFAEWKKKQQMNPQPLPGQPQQPVTQQANV